MCISLSSHLLSINKTFFLFTGFPKPFHYLQNHLLMSHMVQFISHIKVHAGDQNSMHPTQQLQICGCPTTVQPSDAKSRILALSHQFHRVLLHTTSMNCCITKNSNFTFFLLILTVLTYYVNSTCSVINACTTFL